VDAVRGELLLEVRQTFFRLLESQKALELGRQSLESRQLIRRQVQTLTDNQLRSTLDLQFAEVAVSEAETLLARLEGDVRAAGAALSSVLGSTDENAFVLEEPPAPEPLPAAVDPLVEEALRNRPEIISRQQDAAHQLAASEGRLVLPSLSATGGFGIIPSGDPRLRSRYAGLGLNINIPIFNGKAFAARRQEAEARALAAGQDTRDEELRVAREVRTAFAEAQIAGRRIDLAQRQLEKAARLDTLARARYQAGLGTIVEVNQAELAKFSADLGVANARYGLLAASAVLDFSMGRTR
jgi:outer membrane protein